tara:strand:+ start:358 stop:852 length:495 start_codon:yes stop_codon:yes gene_type:complete
MRISLIVFGIFILCLIIYQALKFHGNDPEKLLIGNWQEVSRSYAKIDDPKKSLIGWLDVIEGKINDEANKNIIVHDTETWRISSKGQLALEKESGHEHLAWKLKGRGHILELAYNNSLSEYYSIQEISDDKMVLYYNTDLQVRGIVKMVFEKIKGEEHAQKGKQ